MALFFYNVFLEFFIITILCMKIKALSYKYQSNNVKIEMYNKIEKHIIYIKIYNKYIIKHIT